MLSPIGVTSQVLRGDRLHLHAVKLEMLCVSLTGGTPVGSRCLMTLKDRLPLGLTASNMSEVACSDLFAFMKHLMHQALRLITPPLMTLSRKRTKAVAPVIEASAPGGFQVSPEQFGNSLYSGSAL